ncbi:IS3 family transposase [Stenotrophomonas acidaminiphila]|uniref:IS3 family transposase n=1 Tax=Lysobacteraceae TaxID=32033 RepID=UPI003CCDFB0A
MSASRCSACRLLRLARSSDVRPSTGGCALAASHPCVIHSQSRDLWRPPVFLDLRERGETCSRHRVARLMRENGLHALHGYRIRHIPVAKPKLYTHACARPPWRRY